MQAISINQNVSFFFSYLRNYQNCDKSLYKRDRWNMFKDIILREFIENDA